MEWLQMTLWFLYLGAAVFVLVRGSEVFVTGAKQMGSSAGMSSFAIGVLIVGLGTSLPELASSIAAALTDTTEIVIANVVGSNITNILLIVGLLAAAGGRIVINKDLIKGELPIFFIATAHFIAVIFDGHVDRLEALLLLGTFCAYLWYLFVESKVHRELHADKKKRPFLEPKSIAYILIGMAGVLVGAHFTVSMTVNIATALSVPVGLISIAALAIGTSLPELFVALHAYRMGETDIAIGNIFGSNAFNILVVIGIPALITPLVAGDIIMDIGIPVLIAASAIFFVNGLSRQIMRWEGMMMLLFFAFFILKLAYAV
jgi:cation:H+ antiporter